MKARMRMHGGGVAFVSGHWLDVASHVFVDNAPRYRSPMQQRRVSTSVFAPFASPPTLETCNSLVLANVKE